MCLLGTTSGRGELLRALLNRRCRPDRLNGRDEPLLRLVGRSLFFQERATSGLLHSMESEHWNTFRAEGSVNRPGFSRRSRFSKNTVARTLPAKAGW